VKNCYETLQVFPTAGEQEIKDAFRFLLFRYHPDHNKGREDWAVQRTMELVDAYHTLSNADRRAHHDVMRAVRLREDRGKKSGGGLFGGGGDKHKAAAADEMFKQGVEAYRADEYEAALKKFAKAHELDGENPNTKFNLAACFLALEKLNESANWLQDYLVKGKDDADAKSLFGKITALQRKRK
jgi:DnaJ-class molecular chaperone